MVYLPLPKMKHELLWKDCCFWRCSIDHDLSYQQGFRIKGWSRAFREKYCWWDDYRWCLLFPFESVKVSIAISQLQFWVRHVSIKGHSQSKRVPLRINDRTVGCINEDTGLQVEIRWYHQLWWWYSKRPSSDSFLIKPIFISKTRKTL